MPSTITKFRIISDSYLFQMQHLLHKLWKIFNISWQQMNENALWGTNRNAPSLSRY